LCSYNFPHTALRALYLRRNISFLNGKKSGPITNVICRRLRWTTGEEMIKGNKREGEIKGHRRRKKDN
jgi:hypothetical protein